MRLIGLLIAVCIGVGLMLVLMEGMTGLSTAPDADDELLNGSPTPAQQRDAEQDEPEGDENAGQANEQEPEQQRSGSIPGQTRDRVQELTDEHTDRQMEALEELDVQE